MCFSSFADLEDTSHDGVLSIFSILYSSDITFTFQFIAHTYLEGTSHDGVLGIFSMQYLSNTWSGRLNVTLVCETTSAVVFIAFPPKFAAW
jgi:hypothetical protein